MEKKYQILYIWSFIIVAGIILLLLYTPIGGSLHQSNDISYYRYNTGVDFGGKITNSPRIKAAQPNVESEEEIKNNIDLPKFKSTVIRKNRNNSVNIQPDYSIDKMSKSEDAVNQGAGSLSNPFFASKTGKNNGSNSTFQGNVQKNELFANEINTNSNTTVMQKGTNETTNNSDPGGDPNGNPIPVGNEFPVLLLLATVYFIYKKSALRK